MRRGGRTRSVTGIMTPWGDGAREAVVVPTPMPGRFRPGQPDWNQSGRPVVQVSPHNWLPPATFMVSPVT